MRVTAVCVGAGMCALTAPELFEQDDDGIVTVLRPDAGPHDQAAREAEALCPSGAVQIVEE